MKCELVLEAGAYEALRPIRLIGATITYNMTDDTYTITPTDPCSLCHDDGLSCPACHGERERDLLRDLLVQAKGRLRAHSMHDDLTDKIDAALAGKEPR